MTQPNTTCGICDRPHSAPRPRIALNGGQIVEQCVASCHDRHVMATAPSNKSAFLRDAKRRFRRAGVTRQSGIQRG